MSHETTDSKNAHEAKEGEGAPDEGAKLTFAQRFKKGLQSVRTGFLELGQGLLSPDRPTRKMSAVFFISLLGVLVVLGAGVYRYRMVKARQAYELMEAEKTAKHLGDILAKRSEESKQKVSQIPIGSFSVELQPLEGQTKKIPGVQSLAEIELVLNCDSKETREYIEEHLPQARNQVTNYFTIMNRSALMSSDGKKKIKNELQDRLNNWLPHGRVEEIFIVRFLMT